MSADYETQTRRIEAAIGYTFKDSSLLETALTHKSYVNETAGVHEDNQRLEFLGDAVLGLVMAEDLMARLDSQPEGVLTKWRAALVNEQTLADAARDIGLGDALRLGHGEQMNNGRDRASTLADVVEAVIGAIHLDGGFHEAKAVILGWFGQRLAAVNEADEPNDPKGELQEILQARGVASPQYRLIGEEGPDHAKVFEVEISVGDDVVAVGRGRSKKTAEKNAAFNALEKVKQWST